MRRKHGSTKATDNLLIDSVDLSTSEALGLLPVSKGGTGLTMVGAEGTVLTVVGGVPAWATPAAGLIPHADTHESGGSDEIDVTGLFGLLADPQSPLAHTHVVADISDWPSTFPPSAHTHLWADITDPPSTFPPSAHTHPFSEITGTISSAQHGDLSTVDTASPRHHWNQITNKPSTFTPSAHTHPFSEITGTISSTQHGDLSAVDTSANRHHWNQITNKPATFPAEAHALVGAIHTVSGLTTGHVLTATSATTYAFQAPTGVAAHDLVGALHTASGLTTGHFLKATSATAFAFQAHGLTAADVGAAAASHTHSHTALTFSGLTTGQVWRATSATAASFGALDLGNTNAVTGTLADARLSNNVVLLDSAQTITGVKTISNTLATGFLVRRASDNFPVLLVDTTNLAVHAGYSFALGTSGSTNPADWQVAFDGAQQIFVIGKGTTDATHSGVLRLRGYDSTISASRAFDLRMDKRIDSSMGWSLTDQDASLIWRVDWNKTQWFGGHLRFITDATHDIGASGANRPRDLFLSRNLTVGDNVTNSNATIRGLLTIRSVVNSVSPAIDCSKLTTETSTTVGILVARRADSTFPVGILAFNAENDASQTARGRIVWGADGFDLLGGTTLRIRLTNSGLFVVIAGGSLKEVSEGAAESGGSGFKVLRVPN